MREDQLSKQGPFSVRRLTDDQLLSRDYVNITNTYYSNTTQSVKNSKNCTIIGHDYVIFIGNERSGLKKFGGFSANPTVLSKY